MIKYPIMPLSIDYDARFVDIAILELVLIAGGAFCTLFFVTMRKRNTVNKIMKLNN